MNGDVDGDEGVFVEGVALSKDVHNRETLDERIWDEFLVHLVDDATFDQKSFEEERDDESSTSLWSLYFDGACRGKDKLGSCGIVIYPPKGNTILLGVLLGNHLSNNIAEYQALLIGLRALLLLGAANVHIYGDSQLVVDQFHGQARTLHPLMHYYSLLARDLFTHFTSYTLTYLPRQKNTVADSLALMALSGSFTQNFDRTLVDTHSFDIDPWELVQDLKCLGVEVLGSLLRELKSSHPSTFTSLVLSMTRRLIHLSDVNFLTIDPSHLLMIL